MQSIFGSKGFSLFSKTAPQRTDSSKKKLKLTKKAFRGDPQNFQKSGTSIKGTSPFVDKANQFQDRAKEQKSSISRKMTNENFSYSKKKTMSQGQTYLTGKEKNYDIDVIEVSNIALAIKNKQHTINIELSLRCENLPLMKTFGSTDSMVVIYKSNDNFQQSQLDQEPKSGTTESYPLKSRQFLHKASLGSEQWVEIGRTEVIYNELNPKYIKTFVFSYNEEKQQKILFQLYDIVDPNNLNDLGQQVKIAHLVRGMDQVVENDHGEFEWVLENKKRSKTLLKTTSSEYDSGNSKYQISLELSNFVGRLEVFYVIQVLKLNEWIPIAKSEPIEIKKNLKFQQQEISYNKFPAEDSSRIKIKVYEISKGKTWHQEELGSTDELTVLNIMTTDDKTLTQRVYKNGFVVGVVKINKWRKVIRDSFISYIVNGATLHLILGIDFSSSNSCENGENSLHTVVNGSNPYIEGIRKIIGVLQYFDYYNQVALYGFGAQLPPYYRNVSQCFALNGNYFNPIVSGGVEQIISLYKENLAKNKLHGPTKLSQMIDLAINYAESEQNSANYYVLILMTDGQIDDFYETVNRVVKASCLPLSIVVVGVGDKDFSMIEELDSDKELLKSTTGEVCERDIVDFIRLDHFSYDQGDTTLARQTFAEIPKQFIDYMMKKNIKPNRQKKSLKAAKQDFISQKIKESKTSLHQNKPIIVVPQFLEYEKKKFKKDLINLGFDHHDPLLKDLNIAMNDLNYFIQVHSYHKKTIQTHSTVTTQRVAQRQERTLEEYLDRKEMENKKKTLEKLQKIETNQYGRQIKPKQIQPQIKKQEFVFLDHPCVKCRRKEIDFLHVECGHASVCQDCMENRCYVCKLFNTEVMKISDYVEPQSDSESNSEFQQ